MRTAFPLIFAVVSVSLSARKETGYPNFRKADPSIQGRGEDGPGARNRGVARPSNPVLRRGGLFGNWRRTGRKTARRNFGDEKAPGSGSWKGGPNLRRGAEKTCLRCRVSSARARQLEVIREKILRAAHRRPSDSLPNRAEVPAVPPVLRLLERMDVQGDAPYSQQEPHDAEERADTIQQLFQVAQKPFPTLENASGICYFNLQLDLVNYSVDRASLWVFVEPERDFGRHSVVVGIFRVDKIGDTRHVEYHQVASRKVETGRKGRWTHFDVKSLVLFWLEFPRRNHGLRVSVRDMNDKQLRVSAPDVSEDPTKYPVLDVKPSRRSRRRREKRGSSPPCSAEGSDRRCCLYPLVVNFKEDLNMSWVIAPRYFHANVCSGRCGLDSMQEHPYLFLPRKYRTDLAESPCCSPTETSGMDMIFLLDNGETRFVKLKEMTVESCGCR